jgi:enamine deaminase RidA (YjgF/YER057c/UK114 family)
VRGQRVELARASVGAVAIYKFATFDLPGISHLSLPIEYLSVTRDRGGHPSGERAWRRPTLLFARSFRQRIAVWALPQFEIWDGLLAGWRSELPIPFVAHCRSAASVSEGLLVVEIQTYLRAGATTDSDPEQSFPRVSLTSRTVVWKHRAIGKACVRAFESVEEPLMTDDTAAAIRRVNPPELGAPPGYSHVVDVRAGRIIFVAGQTSLDQKGELVGKSDFAAQAAQVFRNLSAALESVGCTASNLVKLTVFLRDMENLPTYREARNRFFATVTPPAAPAVTLVEVSRLYGPDFMIEIEAIAAA